jgi:hypothetical protein
MEESSCNIGYRLMDAEKSLIDIDVTALKPGIIYGKNVQS